MPALRLLLLSLLLATAAHGKYVPTPEMAMRFNLGRDATRWEPQFMDGNASMIIFEFVPAGQSIKAWEEMVAQQIAFTRTSLRKHVDEWRAMLRRADPQVEIAEETAADGSILATYTSLRFREFSLRRFIRAKDGIYMLAYHVRPDQRDEARVALWREILLDASLIPNPEKRRK